MVRERDVELVKFITHCDKLSNDGPHDPLAYLEPCALDMVNWPWAHLTPFWTM